MTCGPILGRELLTLARRGATFRRRCLFTGVLLLEFLLLFVGLAYLNPIFFTIRGMVFLGYIAFGIATQCQVVLAFWLVPACVAAVIAEEKERRTLTGLLTTRLSSAEIVLGKLAAGLLQYATCLAAGMPIMLLLPLLGGVDPWLVVLLYAGTVTTAFFLAGLSIVVSTAARRGVRAFGETILWAGLWCGGPMLVQFLVPRSLPWLWPWVYRINEWGLASSPTGLLLVALGAGPGWRLLESLYWMIGLQLAAGSLLIAWAIARFRAACRDHEEGDDRKRRRDPFRLLYVRRPRSGDDPVLWKELHTARPRGFEAVLGMLIGLGLAVLIGYGTYRFAQPAFLELYANGLGRAASDQRRTEFNEFLRILTSWVEFFTLLIAAGVAAEGVATERARGTWDGLIATPLDGRVILRAKMLGAAWKVRWGVIQLGVLWSVGLLAGAVHPLSFAAAVVLLGAATWFMVALGTFMSLVARDTAQASNYTLIPVLLLLGSFIVWYLPVRPASILMGIGSAPFVNWLTLLSYREIAAIPPGVLPAWLLGAAGHAVGAAGLSRAACARFDRAVGRPMRAEGAPGQSVT